MSIKGSPVLPSSLGASPFSGLHFGQFLAVGVLLLVLVQGWAQVVMVTAGENGTFRLPVTLNGRWSAKALIDTGATAVVLCLDTAKVLDLKLGESVDVATVNGRVSARRAWLTSIQIEKITLRNVPVTVLPTQDCGEIILGMAAPRELPAVFLRGDLLILIGTASPCSMRQLCR